MRYTQAVMRRSIAIALTMLFSWLLLLPAFAAAGESIVPACCRKSGKHHCMAHMNSHSTEPVVAGVHDKCPCAPQATVATHVEFSAPAVGRAIYAGTCGTSHGVASDGSRLPRFTFSIPAKTRPSCFLPVVVKTAPIVAALFVQGKSVSFLFARKLFAFAILATLPFSVSTARRRLTMPVSAALLRMLRPAWSKAQLSPRARWRQIRPAVSTPMPAAPLSLCVFECGTV